MLRLAFFLIYMALSPAAFAANLTGAWDVVADGRVISRIELRKTPAGWSGVWARPTNFSFDGNTFTEIEGPVERRSSTAVKELHSGVEISFADPRPDSTPDVFRMSPLDTQRALLYFVGPNFEPITLIRSKGARLGPWEKAGRYTRTVLRTDNTDLKRIFDEDQADRFNEKIAVAELTAADARRKEAVRGLVESGKLSSEQDFYRAALIFQHGDSPRDYLWAHTLATIAAARGNTNATWLAAASLDRYLRAIGQPQVFGTQYSTTGTNVAGPSYDPSMLPDSLRQYMRVPEFSKQDARIRRQAASAH